MTLRIDVNEVGDRIEEALERAAAGEEVLVERAGSVVAEIKARDLKPGGLRAFFEKWERVGAERRRSPCRMGAIRGGPEQSPLASQSADRSLPRPTPSAT